MGMITTKNLILIDSCYTVTHFHTEFMATSITSVRTLLLVCRLRDYWTISCHKLGSGAKMGSQNVKVLLGLFHAFVFFHLSNSQLPLG